MIVQRVDHLAVQTLIYTQHQYLPAFYTDLFLREYFISIYISIFIANLTHVS